MKEVDKGKMQARAYMQDGRHWTLKNETREGVEKGAKKRMHGKTCYLSILNKR